MTNEATIYSAPLFDDASSNLDVALRNAIDALRQELGRHNIGYIHFNIETSGYTQTDRNEFKIEYTVYDSYSHRVEGSNLAAITDEYIRRNSWNKRNAPLSLGYDKQG